MRLVEIRALSLRELSFYVRTLNRKIEIQNPDAPVNADDEYGRAAEDAVLNTPGARL